MLFYGVAAVDNKPQRDNLCECITILGGEPRVSDCNVSVEYRGSKDECDKFVSLFKHYNRYGVYTEN